MSLRAALFVSILALATLAGCVGQPPPSGTTPPTQTAPADWSLRAMPMGEGHDHRDVTQHLNLSTPNFQLLAYDPLPTDHYDNKTAVGYFCGGDATTADGRKLTVVSSLDSDVAFVLVDVTDPRKPTKVGEYVIQGTTHYDVDITPDGKHVVVGSDVNPGLVTDKLPGLALPLARVQPTWRDACTGEERAAGPEEMLPLGPATLLVDVSDPKNPTLVDAAPAPVLGPHSVSTARIDGKTYVVSSITNLAQPVDYFQFFEVTETPAGAKLALLSTVDGSQYGSKDEVTGGHVDAELALHPVTKKMVAYLSDWNAGMIILDMSNPRVPMLLSAWKDPGVEGGNVHSTRSVEGLWDGKHYVIAGQEFTHRPENRPSGWIYVIDDTDPTKPVEVGRWTLPHDSEPEWHNLETFSTHYFRLVDRTLFVAMYHVGLWALDLSEPANPVPVGVFMPDKAPPAPRREPTGFYDLTPFVLDVFPQPDYTLTVFDGYSGAYSLKFDPASPAPAPAPWPVEGQPHED